MLQNFRFDSVKQLCEHPRSNIRYKKPEPHRSLRRYGITQIYLEFFASPDKLFTIHIEVSIRDREPGVRFTLTNMEKEYSVSGGNVSAQ